MISKRIRFEVFKRDYFTCQYCGAQAPAVLLHADHIHPRSKGGDDELMNLVTACESCNLGKSNVSLSDESAVLKRKAQMDKIQERREQLELMFEWHKELLSLEAETINSVAGYFEDLCRPTIVTVSDCGCEQLRRHLKKFGLNEVLEAVSEAILTYGKADPSGGITRDSAAVAISKIGPICAVRKQSAAEPYLKDLYYIRGILRNRVGGTYGFSDTICIIELRRAAKVIPPPLIQWLACGATTWREFSSGLRLLEQDYCEAPHVSRS